MAVTNGWGQGVINNSIEWGKGSTNATNGWGEIYEDSPSGDTAIEGASFSEVYSTEYDGVDDYVKTDANYTELDGANKLTVSAWIKVGTTSDSLSYLCNILGGSLFQVGIRLQTTTNTQCWFYINNSSGSNRASANIGALKGDGNWHHLLVCADLSLGSGEIEMYLDGVSKTVSGTITETTFPSATSALHIGTRADSLASVYGGDIDEFALWSGTDLRGSVATIFNSGVPNDLNSNGLTAPTSWYRFEEGSGTTAADSGSSSNDASLINGTAFSSDVPT
tara:strand:+ start:2835 stop:3671 length:837 start_codon:yes stop_codon:yes gene_type:complete